MEYTERTEYTEVPGVGQEGGLVFHILEHIGVLSETKGWRRELNVVSWNHKPAKFDIRDWDEYHEHMKKGITFTKGELKELRNILVDVDFSKTEIPETKSRRSRGEGMTEPPAAAGQENAAAGTGSDETIPF